MTSCRNIISIKLTASAYIAFTEEIYREMEKGPI